MLIHITKSMHLIEIMNFLLYIATNLFSLTLLSFHRYQIQQKRNVKTSSLEVMEMDDHKSIHQAPKPQQLPQPPELTSCLTQAPKTKPTIGSFETPCCCELRYGIHPPPIEADAYEIKGSLVRLIQDSRFLGTKAENPYDHLDSFERLCATFRIGGVSQDSVKLILFPFSFGGKASQWERALPSHLVNSWDDCKRIFLLRFYPIQRTVQTRKDILSFKKGIHETFHEAWERLRGYTQDCPHHGFKKEAILNIFYWGVDNEHKWIMDAASKGRFANLTIEQGELLIENLAKSDESYNQRHDFEAFLDGQCEVNFICGYQEGCNSNHHNHQRHHFPPQGYVPNNTPQPRPPTSPDLYVKLAAIHTKMDISINDLHTRLELISSKIKHMEQQDAKASSLTRKLTEELKGRKLKDHLFDENEEAIREIERLLHGSTDEVQAKGVEYVGGNERINVASPPQACTKKKDFQEEKVLGYGNVEEALALDGVCLECLLSNTPENGIESSKEQQKGEGTKAKQKTSTKHHPPTLVKKKPSELDGEKTMLEQIYTMTLTPWKYENGTIEYKVKCKGRSKPFAKVRALLTPKFNEKGSISIHDVMSKVLKLFPSKHQGPFNIKEDLPYGATTLVGKERAEFTMNRHRVKHHMADKTSTERTSVSLQEPP